MVTEIRNFSVVIPPGTLRAAPLTTALAMPSRIVRSVRVRVPPGPRGVMGWALASGGVPFLPWGPDEWMTLDDEAIEWPLAGQLETGAWQLRAYNTGDYAHTLYLTFRLDPLASSANGQVLAAPLVLEA